MCALKKGETPCPCNGGFTLIEVIAAMFIGALIALTAGFFLLYNTNIYTDSNNEVNIQYESSLILEQITIAAKESSAITEENIVEPVDGQLTHSIKYVFNNEKRTEAVYNATLKMLEIRSVDGTRLYESIKEFSITPDADNNKLVQISVTGERGRIMRTFSTTAAFRN